MGFLDRFRRRRETPSGPAPSGKTLSELKEFMASRPGVEAYIEPPTSVYAMTVCLVAADGEYMRRPVKDAKQAREVCGEQGVPMYDARIVGYPRRMREFERGKPQQQVSLDDLPPLEVTDPQSHDERDD